MIIVLSSQSTNHPGLTGCENHEQDHVDRSLSSKAANDGEHGDDGKNAGSNCDSVVRGSVLQIIFELIICLNKGYKSGSQR